MPRTKTGTSSASAQTQSVEAIREQYRLEDERQKANFAAASEDKVMHTIRDVTRNSSPSSLTPTDKETIQGYLTGNIYANSARLIEASRYLYYRSPIYSQLIDKYSSMYCFECRKVEPNYKFSKDFDGNKALKQLDATLDFLDILSLQNNINTPLVNMWLSDVSYNLFFHDDFGSFFWPIDPNEAVIDSIYESDGGICFGFAIDMSKYRSQQRQELIEWLGEPLASMYRTYENDGVRYVHVPAEYSMVIKKRVNSIDTVIPPLLPYLNEFASLNDLFDSQNQADNTNFFKMIYLPLKVLNSAKNSNDFEISPDLSMEYFKVAADKAFPSGVSSAVIPGDELKTIDFSDSVSQDTNRVDKTQQQILGAMSGMGALINSSKAINNTELIKNALKAESAYVLQGVLGQVEAWTNLQLALNISNYCHVSYMPVTIFTKEDYRKTLLEAQQYGYTYRLAYGTLLGFTERQTMAALKFEQDILGLHDIMTHPLVSSYTNTGETENGQVGQGRPESDSGDLSPSGERSRNS